MTTSSAFQYQLKQFEQHLYLAVANSLDKSFHSSKRKFDWHPKEGHKIVTRYWLHRSTESIYLVRNIVDQQNNKNINFDND